MLAQIFDGLDDVMFACPKTSGYPHDVEPIPEKRTFISDERHAHYRKWQATSCPGFTSRKMGVSTRHRSTA